MSHPPAILGIGTALPPFTAQQTTAAAYARLFTGRGADEHRLLDVLYRRSGVTTRSSVTLAADNEPPELFPLPTSADDRGPSTAKRMREYARTAAPLALRAAQAALDAARVAPAAIDQLVTVSCTGFAAPGFDIALVRELPLRPTTGRTHVGFMGCHAALNGLRVASAMVRGGVAERVLLCAAELCSLHFQYGWDPNQVVANSLFSDGAAAIVVGPGTGVDGCWQLASSQSWLLPESEDAMTWSIGDHGFLMTLSAQVPTVIERHLAPALTGWLATHGLSLHDVASWAVHPGGPRILSAVARSLALPASALALSREILAQSGNMSSPTVLFILERMLRAEAPRPCVALGFGPGLNAEALLLT